jgi:glycosyltransferase involved in cell wall biosynthesis
VNPQAANLTTDRKPVHIGMVVCSFSPAGGLELYTWKLVAGLLERGNRVTVFAEEHQRFEHPLLTIHRIEGVNSAGKSDKILAGRQQIARAIASAGDIDVLHSQHYAVDNADVVTFHNHTLGRLSKVGFAWERNLNEMKLKLSPAYQARDRADQLLCASAKCLVFPSLAMQEDFYSRFPSLQQRSAPYVVAHPGADLSTVSPSTNTETDPFTFLFVGRGYRKKGLDVLLSACAMLKGKNFQLQIAGLSEKALDGVRLSMKGLQSHVKFLGFCTDMAAVYARAQVLVLPSRVEPFGMAPIQAMRFGLVPIVSRVAGVSEVLEDGKTALILENPLSAAELAEKMTRLMSDRALLAAMQSRARDTAAALTWDKTVDATLQAYDIALREKAGNQVLAVQ